MLVIVTVYVCRRICLLVARIWCSCGLFFFFLSFFLSFGENLLVLLYRGFALATEPFVDAARGLALEPELSVFSKRACFAASAGFCSRSLLMWMAKSPFIFPAMN